MVKNEKPETLIHLLASYRHAQFPTNQARMRDLAGIATTIQHNCALTVHFADRSLRNLEEDGEEAFTLVALKEEATILKRRCCGLVKRKRRRNLSQEVESLRVQYDNFTGSVKHLFHLLDHGLAGRLDGVL
ncbi:MAG TPA: hypothetical protein VI488_19795 [Candidatus Angelobacter sp.]